MSIFGELRKAGIDYQDGVLEFQHLIVPGAGITARSGNGVDYYVDGANGSDNNDGRSPKRPFLTLAAAYAATTSGQHDTVRIIGGGTSLTISDQLVWSNSYTHLVGISAPTPNTRARISNSGNSTSTNALLKVTGDGCSFVNFRIYQNSATAACHAIEVTGDRNFFRNVTIQGQVNTTAAQGANSSSLKLNGAEEFRFVGCTIGQVTGAARTAGGVLMLDGACGKGDFIDCDFHSYSETSAAEIIKYVDAQAVDRSITFRKPVFYNFSVNHATLLSEVIDMPTSPSTHDMIFVDPTLVGITEMESTGSGFVWVTGGTPAAGTAGSGQTGVAVHPS